MIVNGETYRHFVSISVLSIHMKIVERITSLYKSGIINKNDSIYLRRNRLYFPFDKHVKGCEL